MISESTNLHQPTQTSFLFLSKFHSCVPLNLVPLLMFTSCIYQYHKAALGSVMNNMRLHKPLSVFEITHVAVLCFSTIDLVTLMSTKIITKVSPEIRRLIAGSIPIWGPETFFWVCELAWSIANSLPLD